MRRCHGQKHLLVLLAVLVSSALLFTACGGGGTDTPDVAADVQADQGQPPADVPETDGDGDGILDDGDGSGTAGDGPCTGGETANCDDNCPGEDNADQADLDSDGIGDVCDDDVDGDGLDAAGEATAGTDPLDSDSDDDGLSDGLEVLGPDGVKGSGDEVGTDPMKADTDDDTLDDGVEDANQNGVVDSDETDPTKADTDDDGFDDAAEGACGTDPVSATDVPADADGDGDCDVVDDDDDNDGLKDTDEAGAGTDPFDDDSDDDLILDGIEVLGPDLVADSGDEVGTDPLKADTDDDTLGDGVEDANQNGVIDAGETNPAKADSDDDGWDDAAEPACGTDPTDGASTPLDTDDDDICDAVDDDDDGDGLSDADEATLGTDPLDADSDDDGLEDGAEVLGADGEAESGDETDPNDADSDDDGLSDGEEVLGFDLAPDTGDEPCTSPVLADTDDDGLSDAAELVGPDGEPDTGDEGCTLPCDADSDVDQWTDGAEVVCGSDPCTAVSVPIDTDEDFECNAVDPDDDGDGVPDEQESTLGTNPLAPDSDFDLLGDGLELYGPDGVADTGDEVGTDPTLADSDADGLDDGDEDANRNGVIDAGETSPVDDDSDDDAWKDGVEVGCGSDPLDGDDLPVDTDDDGECDATDDDDDGDGLSDSAEGTLGTNPLVADTDEDGVDDGYEALGADLQAGTGDEIGLDPLDDDTDDDTLLDGVEDANGNGAVDAGETSPVDADSDDDGWDDAEEPACGTDPLDTDSVPVDTNDDGECDAIDDDDDGDGLSDDDEGTLGTDPLDADSDDDGLGDGLEVLGPDMTADTGDEVGTDPLLADSDDDGLDDGEEDANQNGVIDAGETNPTVADSDDDTWDDGDEVLCGTDPLDGGDVPADADGNHICDELQDDDDGDGLSDFEELDRDPPLDPQDPDSDDDLLGDGLEVLGPDMTADTGDEVGTDPLDDDTDDDGLTDGVEDANQNGVIDAGETSPVDADSDDDTWSDGDEVGCGNDPLDTDDVPVDTDEDRTCDPLDDDDDGDGLSDEAEALGADGVADSGDETDPLDADSDDDGLSDGQEVLGLDGVAGTGDETDPNDSDTDDDGLPDGLEAVGPDGLPETGDEMGTDVLDADSDDDDLLDGEEDVNANAVLDAGETDPTQWDTDLDEWGDGEEVACETDPVLVDDVPADNDDDHDCDLLDPDDDNDDLPDTEEGPLGLDPFDADSDDDAITDGLEVLGPDLEDATGDEPGTDPLLFDTDEDGLSDGLEWLGPDAVLGTGDEAGTDPLVADTDADRLLDGDEDANANAVVDAGETDPTVADTDADTWDDGDEDECGTDGTDGADVPLDTDGDHLCDNAQDDCVDLDDDGWGDERYDGTGCELGAGDCDDQVTFVFPGAAEWSDGIDTDCDDDGGDDVATQEFGTDLQACLDQLDTVALALDFTDLSTKLAAGGPLTGEEWLEYGVRFLDPGAEAEGGGLRWTVGGVDCAGDSCLYDYAVGAQPDTITIDFVDECGRRFVRSGACIQWGGDDAAEDLTIDAADYRGAVLASFANATVPGGGAVGVAGFFPADSDIGSLAIAGPDAADLIALKSVHFGPAKLVDDGDFIPQDGDGTCDVADNPCEPGESLACDDNCALHDNPGQEDNDLDGLGDVCDPDDDDDGVLDDADGSGVAGDVPCTNGRLVCCVDCCDDNCPFDDNPDQADNDNDGVGDVCDPDDDDDGVPDEDDICPMVYDPEQGDWDKDDIGDGCQDSDNDGWSDRLEILCGADADAAANRPVDADADGVCDGPVSMDDCLDVDEDGAGDGDADTSGCWRTALPDCDDTDRNRYPGAVELSGQDRDCDDATGTAAAVDEPADIAACEALLGTVVDDIGFGTAPDGTALAAGPISGDRWASLGVRFSDQPAGSGGQTPGLELVDDTAGCPAGELCLSDIGRTDTFRIRFADACNQTYVRTGVCLVFVGDEDPAELVVRAYDRTGVEIGQFANATVEGGVGADTLVIAAFQADDMDIARLDIDGTLGPADDIPLVRVLLGEAKRVDDGDAILSDGDGSCTVGDHPCTSGLLEGCDDNCPTIFNPNQRDLDCDGLGDACDPDADGDGIANTEEVNTWGTDPFDTDSDDDGLDDALEAYGPDRVPGTGDEVGTDPADADSDDDGLDDGVEDANRNGRIDAGETDPTDEDSDNDTWPDGEEVICGSNGLDLASRPDDQDLDHVCDVMDDDRDGDGAANEVDCAPGDWSRYPGAPETCDFADNDCNDVIDDVGCHRVPYAPDELLYANLFPVELTGNVTIDAETGAIEPGIRPAGAGLRGGIWFELYTEPGGSTVGVFSFRQLTVAAGAFVDVVGSVPPVFLGRDGISIVGVVSVAGDAGANGLVGGATVSPGGLGVAGGGHGGPGSTNAGAGASAGSGPGAGFAGTLGFNVGSGAGAGAFCGGGGGGSGGYAGPNSTVPASNGTTFAGGDGTCGTPGGCGGNGGDPYGDLTTALQGGSGGAGGIANQVFSPNASGGAGGAGGGAMAFVSGNGITIAATGRVDARGGDGGDSRTGGGAGGSGGAVVLSADTLSVAGEVLAQGGRGGSGGTALSPIDSGGVAGGVPPNLGGGGGKDIAGGGGGGAGRILFRSRVPLDVGTPGAIPGVVRPLPDTACVVAERSTTVDTDNDTWADWLEVWCGSDPNVNASRPLDNDLDRLCDPRDPDDDNDGLLDDAEAVQGTNKWDPDSDDDGLSDGLEVLGPDGVAATGDEVGTSPLDADSDDDDLDDGVEDANRNGVIDDGETDPTLADTDDDGWDDDEELACGTSPTDGAVEPADVDADNVCDVLDPCIDLDRDGVGRTGTDVSGCTYAGGPDSDDTNPRLCVDSDADTCNDCASGVFDTLHDGFDTDGDGECDRIEDRDGDGVTPNGGDCDDEDPQVFPGAQEFVDGVDTDCDDTLDETPAPAEFATAAACVAAMGTDVDVVTFSLLPDGTPTTIGNVTGAEWAEQGVLFEDIADNGATGIGLTSTAGCPSGKRCFYESAGGAQNPDTWRISFVDECGVRYVRQQACLVFVDDEDPASMVVLAFDANGTGVATWDNATVPGGLGDGVLATAGFLGDGAGIHSFETNGTSELGDGVLMVELHLSPAFPVEDHDGVPQDGDDTCNTTDNPCATGETTGCDDNCPTTYNADQADLDEDGTGDACDDDVDGDGVDNASEIAAGLDPADADSDDDGIDDGIELWGADRIPGGVASLTDPLDEDSDDDGLLDGEEDANGDGVVDAGESAPDNDNTDDDLWTDGDEVLCGSDPLLDTSEPDDVDDDGLCDVAQDTCVDGDGDTIGAAGFDTTGCAAPDATDADDADEFVCADVDADGCDDCETFGVFFPELDGDDADEDGLCDAGDDCVDVDGDGYGQEGFDTAGCPRGTAVDCDDESAYDYPGATEYADARDSDCDADAGADVTVDEYDTWAACLLALQAGGRTATTVQFGVLPGGEPVASGPVAGDEWQSLGLTVVDQPDLPGVPVGLEVSRDAEHCGGAPCLVEAARAGFDTIEFGFFDECGIRMTYEAVCVEFIDDAAGVADLMFWTFDAAGTLSGLWENSAVAGGYGVATVGVAYFEAGDVDTEYLISDGSGESNDWIGFRRIAFAGAKPLADGDGVAEDGDGSCDTTDNPCTGFDVAPCDDNCPLIFNPGQLDTDEDGLGDLCDPDADGDGLSNEDEVILGLDPFDADSDDDGLDDGLEYYGPDRVDGGVPSLTDPLEPDSDFDGLKDGEEDANHDGIVDPTETDPSDDNSDTDIWLDGNEVACGSDPLDGASVPSNVDGEGECDLLDPDADNDGFLNADDCEPTRANAYPGAPEICDGVDNDCDGFVDEYPYAGCPL